MIELFRNNLFFNSLLLLPYAAFIRIRSLLVPEAYTVLENDSPLTKIFFNLIGDHPLMQSILAIFLIFFQAVLINQISIKHRLMNEQCLFPGVFYIIWVSVFPDMLVLIPVLIANSFFFFGIYELFSTYKKPKASTHIFNVGLWISIAALIYLPYISLIILGYVGLYILRSFKWVERFQYFSGILVPFFWVLVWQLWNGQLLIYLQEFLLGNLQIFGIVKAIGDGSIAWIVGIVLLMISFIFSYNQFTIKNSIQVQKKIDILYWLILSSLIGLFLVKVPTTFYLILVSIATAIFVSMYFLRIKNKMYGELIHLILLGIMFSMHFDLF